MEGLRDLGSELRLFGNSLVCGEQANMMGANKDTHRHTHRRALTETEILASCNMLFRRKSFRWQFSVLSENFYPALEIGISIFHKFTCCKQALQVRCAPDQVVSAA